MTTPETPLPQSGLSTHPVTTLPPPEREAQGREVTADSRWGPCQSKYTQTRLQVRVGESLPPREFQKLNREPPLIPIVFPHSR